MKRKRQQQLLMATAAAAGLAIGASVALAAHAPVQLYTFEEVGAQFGMPNNKMPVMIDPVTKKGMPYSPKQSCGTPAYDQAGNQTSACHDYSSISDHAFHAAQGRNQYIDNKAGTLMSDKVTYFSSDGQFDSTKPKPWTQSGAMVGKW